MKGGTGKPNGSSGAKQAPKTKPASDDKGAQETAQLSDVSSGAHRQAVDGGRRSESLCAQNGCGAEDQ